MVPITLRMTSMLGRLKAGPASSSDRAVPLPRPAPINPCRMGTSVRVTQYINAPTTEEKRLAPRELPPTRPLTQLEGIIPSWPGRPSRNPATSTPPIKSGKICLVKSQVARNQLSVCPRVVVVSTASATMPAEKAISGSFGKKKRQDQNRGSCQNYFIGLHAKPLYQQHPEADGEEAGQEPFDTINRIPQTNRFFGLSPGRKDQNARHGCKINGILPQRPLHFRFRHVQGGLGLGLFFFSEQQVHDQTDDDAEHNGPHGSRQAELGAEYARCQNDGKGC